ncbi:MAG: hypothetical protein WC645_07595 [Candidatus Margulisiibacteriota bacterium]
MPGLERQVFHLRKTMSGGAGILRHYPSERDEFAGIYARHFSRILRSVLEKLPSFTITSFKGSLIPRMIAPKSWSTGVAVGLKVSEYSGKSNTFYEHRLMTEIYDALAAAISLNKLFSNGDLEDIYFGIEPNRDLEGKAMEGFSVHFVGEGQIFTTEVDGIQVIPAGRFAE